MLIDLSYSWVEVDTRGVWSSFDPRLVTVVVSPYWFVSTSLGR